MYFYNRRNARKDLTSEKVFSNFHYEGTSTTASLRNALFCSALQKDKSPTWEMNLLVSFAYQN